MAKALNMLVSTWGKLSQDKKTEAVQADEYTNVTTDNGKRVLFHVGNGVEDGHGPAPEPVTRAAILDEVRTVSAGLRQLRSEFSTVMTPELIGLLGNVEAAQAAVESGKVVDPKLQQALDAFKASMDENAEATYQRLETFIRVKMDEQEKAVLRGLAAELSVDPNAALVAVLDHLDSDEASYEKVNEVYQKVAAIRRSKMSWGTWTFEMFVNFGVPTLIALGTFLIGCIGGALAGAAGVYLTMPGAEGIEGIESSDGVLEFDAAMG